MFQSFNLLARTSALDNVLMPLAYSVGSPALQEQRRRAIELLERVGLGDRIGHEPAKLSGGQQQRVAIARALIGRPSLVLADEPTGSLDSKASAEILAMLTTLHSETNVTIVVVTHDDAVARHTQRVVRMHDGRVVDAATLAALRSAGVMP